MKKRTKIFIASILTGLVALPMVTFAANNLLHFTYYVGSLTSIDKTVETKNNYHKYVSKWTKVVSGQDSGFYMDVTVAKHLGLGIYNKKSTVTMYNPKVGAEVTVNLGNVGSGKYKYTLAATNASFTGQINIYDTTS